MSNDRNVTKNLIQTLEDGQKGFTDAAEKLSESDRPHLATKFRDLADQRARFSSELETMAAAYGDDIDEDGSLIAAAHRGWMSLKDALAGSDPDGVIEAAEQGEDHAVSEYSKALDEDISPDLRQTVQRQLTDIEQAHAEVKRMKDAPS
ncbi:MAG: PA2169 family four-helix-bundle protein [Ilumatobacter sp.]|uniref:ferritin-like domain-containing protein n=1 Tax=Ilumatobacter sp. TaxID=1967498 RepID=UPI003C7701A7